VQRVDEVTQLCHVLHADDGSVDGGSALTDLPQLPDRDASQSKTTTTPRLNKVLAELLSTEQHYVKVKSLVIC